MTDLLGATALLIIALCVLICAHRWSSAAKILWVAFALRAGAALFHFYVAPLPDSGADAIKFELTAWEWAQGGLGEALGHFTGPSSYFISWMIALFYASTDRSLLLAQSLSVFVGTGTVLLGWLLVRELWGERIAMKAGWVLVFFPTLVLYSAITLREAYIWFFLSLALLGVVRWARVGGLRPILLATFGFVGATFFHGAMVVGLLVFAGVVLWFSIKRVVLGLLRSKLRVFALVLVVLALLPVAGFLGGVISVPKLGDISRISDVEVLLGKMVRSSRSSGGAEDGAAYPAWTVPNSPIELVYKAPIRATYFAFSPFPWDVRQSRHLIGVFDGLLYLALAFLMCRNRKAIWADPAARTVLFILLGYLLVFGLAIGNFGTGIRHRAKIVVMLIALAAPYLFRVRWRFKHRQSSVMPVNGLSKLSSEA
jgi:4-amino-4-deoxy-L-arabinose transferase-like glycosyltransferase